jgi:AcrR family transcriptional regulator
MLCSVDQKKSPATMAGLRERKKQRTRTAIFEAAFRLFAEHGYDGVTMAEIAQAADVAPATVFTHYTSKEDLFYGLRSELNDSLAEAMRSRTAEPGLTVVRDWLLQAFDDLLAPQAIERSRTFSRLLLDTPALWSRSTGFASERQQVLVEVLAERRPDDDAFTREVAAAQIAAAIHSAMRHFQQDLAEGMAGALVRRRSRARAEAAFAQLAGGLEGLV